jgi:hypothetical protein
MRKRTSVQNLFPRIRPANGDRKEQLDFHLAPAVPLQVDGKFRQGPVGSAYFRAQRWPAYIWQTTSKRGSSIAVGDIRRKAWSPNSAFILPMIIRGSEVRQQRLACDLARWGLELRSTFVLDYRNVEEHVIKFDRAGGRNPTKAAQCP